MKSHPTLQERHPSKLPVKVVKKSPLGIIGKAHIEQPTAPQGLHLKFPYIVIDQNQLQDADSIDVLCDQCRRDNLQILFPDVAGFELSRGKDPYRSWSRGLQHLAQHAEHVCVSQKTSILIREEIYTGLPSSNIVEINATMWFRNLLREIANGNASTLHSLINGSVQKLMPESLKTWSKHEDTKENANKIQKYLISVCSVDLRKKLRKSPLEGICLWNSSEHRTQFVLLYLLSQRANPRIALKLAETPSVAGCLASAIATLALDWWGNGGFQNSRPEIATNDLLDSEYATLGALSHSLATSDKRIKRVCQAIKSGMKERVVRLRQDEPLNAENPSPNIASTFNSNEIY